MAKELSESAMSGGSTGWVWEAQTCRSPSKSEPSHHLTKDYEIKEQRCSCKAGDAFIGKVIKNLL